MDKKLEKQLFEKYPKIFKQKDDSIKTSCMPWGINAENGWYHLIDNLCECIQSYIDQNRHNVDMQVETVQVKDNLAGLRFYTSWIKIKDKNKDNKCVTEESRKRAFELIEGMIWFAEHLSTSICENCGSPGKVRTTGYCLKTLCEKCKKKLKYRDIKKESEHTKVSIKGNGVEIKK